MSTTGLRAAFSTWPDFNRRLVDRVAQPTEEQLAILPAPGRWPVWASIGQRVFGMCDVAGAPGAAESPFPNAGYNCPGDDDLEHVWSSAELVDALERTFRIIDGALDTWTLESLDEVIRHPEWGGDHERTRGATLMRTLAHDTWHMAELNESLVSAGLDPLNLWD